MTEFNLSFVAFLSVSQTGVLPSYIVGGVCAQFQETTIQLAWCYFHWQGMYTIRRKASCSLTQGRTLGIAFISYRVHRGLCTILGKTSYTLIRLAKAWPSFPCIICDSVHNSRKTSTYYKSRPWFSCIVILHTVLGKNSYTLTYHGSLREQAFVFLRIAILVQRKI